jgi:hypothetical protein
MNEVRVLAMDPGKEFFAWSVLSLDGHVINTGMIKNLLNDMTYMVMMYQITRFVKEIEWLLSKYAPTYLAVERLTPRPGMGSGATAEYVNVMIGLVYDTARRMKVGRQHAVMPSTWKQWLSRIAFGATAAFDASPQAFGFNHVVKNELKSNPFAIKEHQFDSIGLGLWTAHKVQCVPYAETDGLAERLLESCKNSLKPLWEVKERELQDRLSKIKRKPRKRSIPKRKKKTKR